LIGCILVKEFNWIYEVKGTFGCDVCQIIAFSYKAITWTGRLEGHLGMLYIKFILLFKSRYAQKFEEMIRIFTGILEAEIFRWCMSPTI